MTGKPFEELVTIARAWSRPPAAAVTGGAFESVGFDRGERVFRFTRDGEGNELSLRFDASDSAPLSGIPILVENWGTAAVSAHIDGAPVPHGGQFRYGTVHTLEGTHLIVWLAHAATGQTRVDLTATGDGR